MLLCVLNYATVAASAGDVSNRATCDLRDIVAAPPVQSDCPAPSGAELSDLYSAIRTLQFNDKLAESVRTLESATAGADGDHFRVWYWMARCAIAMGDLPRARKFAERAVHCAPGSISGQFLLGQLEARAGRLDEAIARWRSCTLLGETRRNDPYVTAAWRQLALALEKAGYMRAAAQAFAQFDDAILRTHPEHRYSRALSEVLQGAAAEPTLDRQLALWTALGDQEQAVKAAQIAAARQPADDSIASLYVDQLLAAGQAQRAYEYAIKRLREFVHNDGRSFLAPALRAAQAIDKIESLAEEVALIAEKCPRRGMLQEFASRLIDAGHTSVAADVLQRLQDQPVADARTLWVAAWTQWRLGHASDALRLLRGYLSARPFDGELVTLALAERLHAGAAPSDTGPDTPTASADSLDRLALRLLLLASSSSSVPLPAESAPASQPASAPSHAEAVQLLAEAGAHLDRFEWREALHKTDEALRFAPRSPAAAFLRGRALVGLGQFEQAEDSLRDAAEAADQNPLYAYELGRFYRARGPEHLVSAQRYFQEALSADPQFSAAAEALLEAYLAGNPPKLELAHIVLEKAAQSQLPPDCLRRMHTEMEFANARWSDAHLAELTRQFQENPADAATGRKLVEGKLHQLKAAEAISVITALRQRQPADEDVLRLYVAAQSAVLDFAAALEAQRLLQRRYPSRFEENLGVALLLLHDFQAEEARRQLRSMLESDWLKDPNQTERTRYLLFLAHAKFRDLDAALRLVDQWDTPSQSAEWKERRLAALVESGRAEEAVAMAERDLKNAPDSPEARDRFYAVALQVRAYKPLEEKLREWASRADGLEQLELLLRRVSVLKDDGRAAEGLELLDSIEGKLRDAAAYESGARELQGLRVQCLMAAGQMQKGLELADQLLESPHMKAAPELRFPVRAALLDALRDLREYDRAMAYLGRWHAAGDPPPFDQLVAAWRQQFAQLAGNDELFFSLSEKEYERDPRDIGINNDLGYTWADRGMHLDRAEQMVRYAVASDPLNAAYLDSLGWVYYKLGDMARARKWLARSVQLVDGQDATLYDHLADACWRDGARDDALQAWRQAVKLAEDPRPNSTAALDPGFLPRVREKLAAAEQGSAPPIAELAAR